jgi:glutamyl-tRNA synthetase
VVDVPIDEVFAFEDYPAALARLEAGGRLYRCDCSRAEIARVASAPHAGDEGPRYPGTCRAFGMRERTWKRPPAIRLAVPAGVVHVDDALQGAVGEDVAARVGDFVLRRGDGVWAYQLACVVDDLAMGITEVVRGADLLGSAPRQALLARLLGGSAPRFAHVPLVLAPDGTRLAKRTPGITLRDQRASDTPPPRVLATLAATLGLEPQGPDGPAALLARFDSRRLAGRRTLRLSWAAPGLDVRDAGAREQPAPGDRRDHDEGEDEQDR